MGILSLFAASITVMSGVLWGNVAVISITALQIAYGALTLVVCFKNKAAFR